MTDWARAADMLDTVANLLEGMPDMDPDGAIRIALAGHPHAQIPDDHSEVSTLYDDVARAIEADHVKMFLGQDSDSLHIGDIPPPEAIPAARAAAERFRGYAQHQEGP
ncbi:hypothetical protein ACIBQ1_38195 [Nonomuraea sp. NPDC050153]|uniref:hypothetical protein n=1 Tax=Nonomuraea sp. NPDC050153 TaxID=3364359 RepID=UPI0037A9D5D7